MGVRVSDAATARITVSRNALFSNDDADALTVDGIRLEGGANGSNRPAGDRFAGSVGLGNRAGECHSRDLLGHR